MKASELIKKLQDHIDKHGDCIVAAIDIEGELTPMSISLWIDPETNDVGIESNVFDEDYNVFGHDGEWDEDEWYDKKQELEMM